MKDEAILNLLTNEQWAYGKPKEMTELKITTRAKVIELSESLKLALNGSRMDHVFEALAQTVVDICDAHAKKNKTFANAALLDFFGHTIELQREGSTQYDFRK